MYTVIITKPSPSSSNRTLRRCCSSTRLGKHPCLGRDTGAGARISAARASTVGRRGLNPGSRTGRRGYYAGSHEFAATDLAGFSREAFFWLVGSVNPSSGSPDVVAELEGLDTAHGWRSEPRLGSANRLHVKGSGGRPHGFARPAPHRLEPPRSVAPNAGPSDRQRGTAS